MRMLEPELGKARRFAFLHKCGPYALAAYVKALGLVARCQCDVCRPFPARCLPDC